MFVLKCGNVELPAPVSMSVADEIIWSSDTGRTLTGTMVGDVVAEKKICLSNGIGLQNSRQLLSKRI